MKTKIILAAALLSLGVSSVCAQDAGDISDPKIAIWKADLGDSAKVVLSVQSIVSISMHPYLLNGTNMVTEVTVDTVGNNSLRFYCVHQDSKSLLTTPKDAANAARQRITREVTKQKGDTNVPSVKFPEGTYAHTIEYQLDSVEALNRLYKSLLSVWERSSKKVTTFKLK